MYGSTQFWESFMWIHVTWVHHIWACCAKGSEIVDMDVWGREYHACYILLQWSDAAIKCLALIQGLYMNLVYIQSAHTRENFFLFTQFICIRSSLWIPGWKCKPCSLNGFHHVCGCPLRSISADERGWPCLHFLCCFHTCPFILVLVLVKVKLGAQSYGYILSFCGEILGHYIWTRHEIKMFDHRALYLSQNAQIWLQITTHRSAQ